MDKNSRGYVITASISSLRNIKCDEVWQITRVNNEISGTLWIPELAPSPALFNTYLKEWKGKPADQWWSEYEVKFVDELRSPEKLSKLRKLWRSVESGRTIALVCFCTNSKYCHRSLVGKFLERHGVKVEEFAKSEDDLGVPEQIELF
jgi:uncharacterized protein YeaO (DUF488 family)